MRAPTAHALYACIRRFGGAVVRASAFTSEFVGSILTTDSFEKSQPVNALPKVVGFLRVLWFPPTGKVDRTG